MMRHRGFTLLEVLLVIVLIGILASVVVLNFNRDSVEEQVNREAARFQQVFQFIAETAQLRQQEWGLVVNEQSYAFVYFSDNGWQWAQLPQAAQEHQLPEQVRLQLELEGLPGAEQNLLSELEWQQDDEAVFAEATNPELPPLPKVFMLSSGEISPFRLSFLAKEQYNVLNVQVGTDFSLPLTRFDTDIP